MWCRGREERRCSRFAAGCFRMWSTRTGALVAEQVALARVEEAPCRTTLRCHPNCKSPGKCHATCIQAWCCSDHSCNCHHNCTRNPPQLSPTHRCTHDPLPVALVPGSELDSESARVLARLDTTSHSHHHCSCPCTGLLSSSQGQHCSGRNCKNHHNCSHMRCR
jgi:hypothetical protein